MPSAEAKATREAAKQQGLSKQLSGPAGYREVGCGTVTLYDEDAHRLDTVRYGRAPEYKKKTLTRHSLMRSWLSILAVRPDLEVVALADGAEENWRYFERPVYDQRHEDRRPRARQPASPSGHGGVLRRAERRGTRAV